MAETPFKGYLEEGLETTRWDLASRYGISVEALNMNPQKAVQLALDEYHEGLQQDGLLREPQSRLKSGIEVSLNTGLGFVGSWAITYGFVQSGLDTLSIVNYTVLGCTAWSLLRGWCIRRFFNQL